MKLMYYNLYSGIFVKRKIRIGGKYKLTHSELMIGLACIVAIFVVIGIIKRITKLIVYSLIGLLAFFVINTVISNQSPEAVFNSTKNDAIYTKEIYNYTGKIKESVDNTIVGIENKNLVQLKEENTKFHSYLDVVSKLSHGKELDSFHQKYCDYLKNIVITSDATVKSGDFINGTTKNVEDAKASLNKALDGLTNINAKK